MININNKNWDKLRFSDIKKFLSGADDETFFFEFKSDDESPQKLIKEISAFANTYGGYILLGVNDDKTVGGCTKWTEQRIHTTIHDSITPIPNFDVKRFRLEGKTIFAIKIEEGTMPPYITNKGQIYERVSSGSFPINDSSKLSQLYYKRENQLKRIRNKIELDEIQTASNMPNNICGYLDIGFSLTLSERSDLQKKFFIFDLEPVAEQIQSFTTNFSLSRLGYSYLISIGSITASDGSGNKFFIGAGINNYIEIFCDGSAKCRVLLTADQNDMCADISSLGYLNHVYRSIYTAIFGKEIAQKFISAHKYEKLTVLKQFTPLYRLGSNDSREDIDAFERYLDSHKKKYGNNLMIESSRLPKNDYFVIDKRRLSALNRKVTTEDIINTLFETGHFNLGYIDPINTDN